MRATEFEGSMIVHQLRCIAPSPPTDNMQSSSSSQKFLQWPKQQRHHEDRYSQSKYSRAESESVVAAAE